MTKYLSYTKQTKILRHTNLLYFLKKFINASNLKTGGCIILVCALLQYRSSGVARGGGPPRVSPFWGDTIFFSFETENPLIGRQRPFFFVNTYFRTED